MDSAKQFTRVRADMDLEIAATLSVNPTTAYRMLKDYVQLNEGQFEASSPQLSAYPHTL